MSAGFDVLACPVRLLAELPVPTTLVVEVAGIEGARTEGPQGAGRPTPVLLTTTVLLTTSRARAEAQASAPAPCLTPLEYEALAVALEVDACSREDALRALARKMADASHRITLAGLVGVARGRDGRTVICPVSRRHLLRVAEAGRVAMGRGGADGRRGPTWTFGQLLEALGGELTRVEYAPAEPPARTSEAA